MTSIAMPKRFLVTTVLAAALLFSQGGNLLVAALCPHLQSGMASCETQSSTPTMSHEDMTHEDMGHMGHMEVDPEPEPEVASEPSPSAFAQGQPNDECSHCAVHSRTTTNTASLRQGEVAKRSIDLSIPLQVSSVTRVAASPVPVLISRAHGPPGDPTPRHILNNIFRI